MKFAGSFILTLVSLLSMAGGASANPLTWTLSGVVFGDGGTASGSFTFDADTGAYSNVDIVTTLGTSRSGAIYDAVCGSDVPSCTAVPPNSTRALFLTTTSSDQSGLPGLALLYGAGLTDSGGFVALSFGQEGSCSDAACDGASAPQRFVTAGELVAAPEPASWALLLGGVAGAVTLRRRRHAGQSK